MMPAIEIYLVKERLPKNAPLLNKIRFYKDLFLRRKILQSFHLNGVRFVDDVNS
jgi:hypothetical protein